ncbi:MAG: non-canonical purine NTP pyrophosphatase, RdgB/HAM1 family [Deltaproteobacteria bacterium RBG_19FT_COMBO_60_16]|nr:MAG: non-canonical purine NTP pyrophosphatase, RdgB/HAM1 family [Deltaproteobacteria bacterium RBG_19FT_COMBO_60_16]
MMKLLLATKNRGKVIEIRGLVGLGALKNVQVLALSDMPTTKDLQETGKTFSENARMKALHYATAYRVLCIADDSGLSVEALGGRPGVHSARYAGKNATDTENNDLLLNDLKPYPRPWKAAFVCVAVCALPGRVIAESTGRIAGEVVPVPRGFGGFGYDPVFLVEGTGKTMAELSTEEKNRISHRGQAVRQLVAELKTQGMLG